jgi:para-nitrobenzyl esterase
MAVLFDGERRWPCLLLLLCGGAQGQVAPVVQTESGAVHGSATAAVLSFKNIPYAAAPEGESRWRPPRRAASWEGELDATAWGPRCAQIDLTGKISGAEDCLRLNVWAPADTTAGARPVLVWIHGGSLVRGSAMSSSYDGTHLVERTGVVLVGINYRLGAFGYLPHRVFAAESGTTGNYGLLDQIAALEWVQRNIAAFGGDPRRVAIFGQSAGGFSVCSLIASPLAKNLFSAGIIMSGGCTAQAWEAGLAAGDRLADAAGCADAADTASCLRGLSMESVLQALPPDTRYSATIDGYALYGVPEQIISRGAHNRVPVIVGNTSEEQGGTGAGIVTAADFQGAVLKVFPYPTAMPLIWQHYPLWEYGSAEDAYVAFASDLMYVSAARRIARAFLTGQNEPVYRYVFSHVRDYAPPEVQALGAVHASDTPYVFDKLSTRDYEESEAEQRLVDAFEQYFAALAASGAVAEAAAPLWPAYDWNDSFLRLDSEIRAEEGYRKRQCDFWDWIVGLKP